jgi:hypothetical protein
MTIRRQNPTKQNNPTQKTKQTNTIYPLIPFEKGHKQIVLPDKRTHSGNSS